MNMHWGSYLGGDRITKTCETNVRAPVDAWTHQTRVRPVELLALTAVRRDPGKNTRSFRRC
ncbi:hypothetical protein [Kitasatospora sp. NPDC088548]|uniref:hypothetical protein n=1 Tax=Kitasatospora sp. NPDC088548 TaxID=3364075 RepID=UPI003809D02B